MQRKAFQLRLRPGKEAEYDEAHRHVWPDLLDELCRFGVRDYSIFRRGRELVLVLSAPDWDLLLQQLAVSDVNLRWQRVMAPLFEPVPSLQPGELFATMDQVFHLPGDPP